jgi:CHAT domain-containing protein
VRHFRWVHLACHGEFDLDDPLRSCLEVGPEERLYASEIIEHWSLEADLVTLSACRSGISRVLRGDEPMGLVRAFLQAGARAVLVTLWPVEDISARILMEHFYTALCAGGDRVGGRIALQQAQRYLRDLSHDELRIWLRERDIEPAMRPEIGPHDRPFADPLFWAPYALVGAPARHGDELGTAG